MAAGGGDEEVVFDSDADPFVVFLAVDGGGEVAVETGFARDAVSGNEWRVAVFAGGVAVVDLEA